MLKSNKTVKILRSKKLFTFLYILGISEKQIIFYNSHYF